MPKTQDSTLERVPCLFSEEPGQKPTERTTARLAWATRSRTNSSSSPKWKEESQSPNVGDYGATDARPARSLMFRLVWYFWRCSACSDLVPSLIGIPATHTNQLDASREGRFSRGVHISRWQVVKWHPRSQRSTAPGQPGLSFCHVSLFGRNLAHRKNFPQPTDIGTPRDGAQ